MGGHAAGQHTFRRFFIGGVIAAFLIALSSLPSGAVHADGTFDTSVEYFFCNYLPGDFSGPAEVKGFSDCAAEFGPDAAISGTSGATPTLTDTRRTAGLPLPRFSSPDDGLTGHTVKIVAGTNSGDVRTIASNTDDTLTVTADWSTAAPDATSVYVIDPEEFSPGANPDWGFRWTVPDGDYNFSTFATFMSDEFDIAADADIDDGTVVGGNMTGPRLGLATNPCNNDITPNFILYDSTTNTSNTVDALPEGTTDRFSNLKTDGGDSFPGQADADSPAVLQYPSFLNTLFDPDLDYPGDPGNGPLDPISPHARYTGLTKVSTEWIFFTILVFEKTQLDPFVTDPQNATHPFARYGRNPDEAGWVHILILQDPSERVASTSIISDFCTPMVADTMFLGQVTDTTHGTVNRLTSPTANGGIDGEGTHPLLLYALSIRDTDGDGLENSFDTCPFAANVDDPRSTNGDDFDMIDPACDPFPAALDADEDDDGFLNSQDNCPLVANATQTQGEEATTYILAAPDGGFKDDSIGDACDSEFGLGNGEDDDLDGRIDEDPANGVNDDGDGLTDEDGAGAVGNTPDESGLPLGSDDAADGGFLHDMITDAVCIGGVDTTPADGFCDAGGLSEDDIDTDGDGHPNDNEVFMQTDPLVDCTLVLTIDTNADTVPDRGVHDAWPPDFNQDRVINIVDLNKILPPPLGAWGATPGNGPYTVRRDIYPDGVINLPDLNKILPAPLGSWGESCTP